MLQRLCIPLQNPQASEDLFRNRNLHHEIAHIALPPLLAPVSRLSARITRIEESVLPSPFGLNTGAVFLLIVSCCFLLLRQGSQTQPESFSVAITSL